MYQPEAPCCTGGKLAPGADDYVTDYTTQFSFAVSQLIGLRPDQIAPILRATPLPPGNIPWNLPPGERRQAMQVR